MSFSLLQVAFPGFTDRSLKALSVACKRAATGGRRHVTPEHILLALAVIEVGPGRAALENLGIDLRQDVAQLETLALATPGATTDDRLSFSSQTEQLLVAAKTGAAEWEHDYVGTEHLVLGLLRCGPCPVGDYLRQRGVTVDRFRLETLKILGRTSQD